MLASAHALSFGRARISRHSSGPLGLSTSQSECAHTAEATDGQTNARGKHRQLTQPSIPAHVLCDNNFRLTTGVLGHRAIFDSWGIETWLRVLSKTQHYIYSIVMESSDIPSRITTCRLEVLEKDGEDHPMGK